jgi:lysophospholipase L1-like esterase
VVCSKYQRSIDIVNRGYSGYNTSWLLSILDKIEVDFANAEFAFIMMGANDAATNLQIVEIPRFKENLEKIVEKVSRAGAKKIVLVQTPWVSAKDWQKFCSEKYPDEDSSVPNRTAERAQKYAQAGIKKSTEKN